MIFKLPLGNAEQSVDGFQPLIPVKDGIDGIAGTKEDAAPLGHVGTGQVQLTGALVVSQELEYFRQPHGLI